MPRDSDLSRESPQPIFSPISHSSIYSSLEEFSPRNHSNSHQSPEVTLSSCPLALTSLLVLSPRHTFTSMHQSSITPSSRSLFKLTLHNERTIQRPFVQQSLPLRFSHSSACMLPCFCVAAYRITPLQHSSCPVVQAFNDVQSKPQVLQEQFICHEACSVS